MAERKVAQLRTGGHDILPAGLFSVHETLRLYNKIIAEDQGVAVGPNLYADESRLLPPLPLIQKKPSITAEMVKLLREEEDILPFLARNWRCRAWAVPARGGIEAVRLTVKPWILSDPLGSFGEAVRIARGIELMDAETFVDYTNKS